MKKPNYRIYPTLLDAFNYYVAPVKYLSEKEDAPSEQEITDKQFKELIDKINRVPYETTEAQQKGCDFESLVNELLDGKPVETVETQKNGTAYKYGANIFSKDIADRVTKELTGCSTRSERISTVLNTPVGLVELYGVMDYSFPGIQVDLKTTGKYDFLKYKDNTQHKVYPVIARENFILVDEFNYLVTDFKDVYVESYTFSFNLYDEVIANICQFVDFIEQNRHLITDKKIFALD